MAGNHCMCPLRFELKSSREGISSQMQNSSVNDI